MPGGMSGDSGGAGGALIIAAADKRLTSQINMKGNILWPPQETELFLVANTNFSEFYRSSVRQSVIFCDHIFIL